MFPRSLFYIKRMNSKIFNLKHPIVGILIPPGFEKVREDRFGSNSCFLSGLKPIIFLGRCLGPIFRNDILEENGGTHHKKINPSFFICCLITIFLLLNASLLIHYNFQKFREDKTVLVQTSGFSHAGYATSMCLIYSYQLLASEKFRDVVRKILVANRLSELPSFKERRGISSYPLFSWLTLTACLLLGIVENALFDWQSLRMGVTINRDNKKHLSVLELYYNQNFGHWHVLLPEYNAVLTLLLVVLTKLATYGWIYMDVICIVLCRALWEKLWIIAEQFQWQPFGKVEEETENVSKTTATRVLGSPDYNRTNDIFKEEYALVTDLVDHVQKYISPMIVVCYIGNMYIVIVMMFNWIGPFSFEAISTERTIHVSFTFSQFLFRVVVNTFFAGEVHQMSLEIRRRLQMCPNAMYTSSLERLERILMASPAGICLFGSFMITRKFFVSIVQFIFTTEIVLLQSYASYNTVHNVNMTT